MSCGCNQCRTGHACCSGESKPDSACPPCPPCPPQQSCAGSVLAGAAAGAALGALAGPVVAVIGGVVGAIVGAADCE